MAKIALVNTQLVKSKYRKKQGIGVLEGRDNLGLYFKGVFCSATESNHNIC